MTDYSTLRVEAEGGVALITLNRPEKRNALNAVMIREILYALRAAEEDAGCGVVLLTGAGGAFCAGMDLAYLEGLNEKSPDEHRADTEQIAGLLRTLYDLSKPTIAAVNGAAVAGGMGLATVCDFTLAVPEAKFGYTEVRIGFIPAVVSAFLRNQVGEKRARDLLLTGRLIGAEEAERMGLVTRVVAAVELMQEARGLAAKLLENSPQAMRATKRLLGGHARVQLDAEIEAAIAANVAARETGDFREGVRAFLEKRKPRWGQGARLRAQGSGRSVQDPE
ncbi:MAG: enoyl-CoA hydratase/isomerase family protein [Acidobacteriaceae bacterium]